MAIKLDKFDRTILQELDLDASVPLHALAKKLQRSKQFVSYRIKRLEEEGGITGYTAMIDVLALGYFTFRIFIDFSNMTEAQKKEFAKKVKKYPQVINMILTSEKWDLGLYVLAKDIKEFRDFWDEILQDYRKNIKKHQVSIYAPLHNFNKIFQSSKDVRRERIFGYGKDNDHSSDIKLLLEYAKNVRTPLIELSTKVGKSALTVKKILNRLKKDKTIIGYNLELSPRELGYRFFHVSFELKSLKDNNAIFRFCKGKNQIYQVNRIIGGGDLEIMMMVKSKSEMLKTIDEIKTKFSDSILDDEYFEFTPLYSQGVIPS